MPSHSQTRTFDAPIERVREAAHDALLSLGSEVEEREDGMVLTGTTGWTAFSFGEHVVVSLEPGDAGVTATVDSSQRARFALMDLGSRNKRNVGTVLNAMASRLDS